MRTALMVLVVVVAAACQGPSGGPNTVAVGDCIAFLRDESGGLSPIREVAKARCDSDIAQYEVLETRASSESAFEATQCEEAITAFGKRLCLRELP